MSKQKPRVYSYIRFSTPEQAMGDSERRQVDDAKAWAERNGHTLDLSLRMADRGLSGYKGHHRTKGALGQFLRSVEAGEVPKGSILVVENIDRLSREGVIKALQTLIFDLIEYDITIQTLRPETTYDRAAINGYGIYELIGQIKRAHDESERKSERISAARNSARKAARESKIILTAQAPKWLRIATDDAGERRFEEIHAAVKTVRMIFEMKLKGVGTQSMVTRLNGQSPWKPAKTAKRKHGGWASSYIKKILSNRAVLGEYQPFKAIEGKRQPEGDPIPRYFPQIIETDVFDAVQAKLAANKGKGGRRGKISNLFTHLVKCAYCGGSMMVVDKGSAPKGGVYLVCYNARRGVCCKAHTIRYDECEETILDNCHKLRPEQVLPNPDQLAKECDALRQRVQGKSNALQRLEQQITNLEDSISDEDDSRLRDRLKQRMTEKLDEKSATEQELQNSKGELHRMESSQHSFKAWKASFETLRKSLSDVSIRQRLQGHLRELIDRIDVFAVGFEKVYDPIGEGEGETIADALEEIWSESSPGTRPDKAFREFQQHVLERLMSKEGRFLRVHFKTGAVVELVPDGSLASGSRLTVIDDGKRKSWKAVSPVLSELLDEFTSNRKHKHTRRKSIVA